MKKRKELWCKALGKSTFEEAQASTAEGAAFIGVSQLKEGKFKLEKVPRMAVEVLSVETVGNCFKVMVRDVHQ